MPELNNAATSDVLDISSVGPVLVGSRAVSGSRQGYVWSPDGGLETPGALGGGTYDAISSVSANASTLSGFRGGGMFHVVDGVATEVALPPAIEGGEITSLCVTDDLSGYAVASEVNGRKLLYLVNGQGTFEMANASGGGEIQGIAPDASRVIAFTMSTGLSLKFNWVWDVPVGRTTIQFSTGPGDAVTADGIALIDTRLWTVDGIYLLNLPPEDFLDTARAHAADARFLTIVGETTTSTTTYATVWDDEVFPHDLKDYAFSRVGLNLSGWDLQTADAVSDDGKIISGLGRTPQGQSVRYVLDLRTEVLCADQNGDGELTGNDFWTWFGNFGAGSLAADSNGDGVLTGSDFSTWNTQFLLGDAGPRCIR